MCSFIEMRKCRNNSVSKKVYQYERTFKIILLRFLQDFTLPGNSVYRNSISFKGYVY